MTYPSALKNKLFTCVGATISVLIVARLALIAIKIIDISRHIGDNGLR